MFPWRPAVSVAAFHRSHSFPSLSLLLRFLSFFPFSRFLSPSALSLSLGWVSLPLCSSSSTDFFRGRVLVWGPTGVESDRRESFTMENRWDFLEWLGPDASTAVLMLLDDPGDLVRVSSVSRSWRRFGESPRPVRASRIWCGFLFFSVAITPLIVWFVGFHHFASIEDFEAVLHSQRGKGRICDMFTLDSMSLMCYCKLMCCKTVEMSTNLRIA